MAEGAPLLREYGVDSSIEGSNPSLSATALLLLRQIKPLSLDLQNALFAGVTKVRTFTLLFSGAL